MIWESYPWKQSLLRDTDIIARWSKKNTTSQRREFILESKIFLAAYSIRKLFDAGKLTDNLRNRTLKCEQFSRTSKRMTPINSHRVEELYDLKHSKRIGFNAKALLDQIIHSHTFILCLSEANHVADFLVTSDRDREKHLLKVQLDDFCSFMRVVGQNYPAEIHTWLDSATNKWKAARR